MGGKEEENICMTQDEKRQGENNIQEKEGDLGGQTGRYKDWTAQEDCWLSPTNYPMPCAEKAFVYWVRSTNLHYANTTAWDRQSPL